MNANLQGMLRSWPIGWSGGAFHPLYRIQYLPEYANGRVFPASMSGVVFMQTAKLIQCIPCDRLKFFPIE